MCSSAARFMAIQDGLPLPGCEQASERARLPQPSGVVAWRSEECQQSWKGDRIQQPAPLDQCCRRVGTEPAIEVRARHSAGAVDRLPAWPPLPRAARDCVGQSTRANARAEYRPESRCWSRGSRRGRRADLKQTGRGAPTAARARRAAAPRRAPRTTSSNRSRITQQELLMRK